MLFFKFHIGDWESGTKLLTPTEKGVYLDLLLLYYSKEEPILRSYCERITRGYTDEERKAFDYVVSEFFTEEDGRLYHSRCEEEINASREKSQKARQSVMARYKKATNEERTKNERSTNDVLTNNHNPLTNTSSSAPRISDCLTRFGQNPVSRPTEWESDDDLPYDEPLNKQIEKARCIDVDIDDLEHVLTASEIVVLGAQLGVRLTHTSKIDEIAKRKTLTVKLMADAVQKWRGTVKPANYLVGILENVSKQPDCLEKPVDRSGDWAKDLLGDLV